MRISESLLIRFAMGYKVDPNPLLVAAGFPALQESQSMTYDRDPSFTATPEGHGDDDDPILIAGRRAAQAAYDATYDEFVKAMRKARRETGIGFGEGRYDSEDGDADKSAE